MFLFDLCHSDTVQLITVTQKRCFYLSVSTRMILCRVLHALCYSLGPVKLGTRPWYSPVHIQNYSPDNSSMTCAMKDNSWNSKEYFITFYIINWVIIIKPALQILTAQFNFLSKVWAVPCQNGICRIGEQRRLRRACAVSPEPHCSLTYRCKWTTGHWVFVWSRYESFFS